MTGFGKALVLALPLGALGGLAEAHQINGDWCSAAGHHIRVDGANVTTPGGNDVTALAGDRHGTIFALPEGEESAGDHVQMQVLNDDQRALVKIGDGEIMEWSRCDVIS